MKSGDSERRPWSRVEVGETIYDSMHGAWIVDDLESTPAGLRVRLVYKLDHGIAQEGLIKDPTVKVVVIA